MSILIRIVSIIILFTYSLLPNAEVQAAASFQTHHDTIPNFAQNPTIRSAQSGSWSSVGTWNLGRLPGPTDVVLITHTVTYGSTTGDVDTIGIDIGGTLRFQTNQNTALKVGTLLVMPDGTLEVGTESSSVPANIKAEIIIKNKLLNLSLDSGQYGTALLVLGNLKMHGAVKTPTFVRLASEPRAGQTTLSVEQPVVGWQAGDRLILPDTRHLRDSEVNNWAAIQNQWEELTLQNVSTDGRTLTLSSALSYDHLGARDGDGTLDFLPHVGNLTRNVVVRSETPFSMGGTKGHTLFTDRADTDVRYTQFKDLGRTTIDPLDDVVNHIGRYAIHFHHLMGSQVTPANGYQFTFVGNSVDGDSDNQNQKWGIAVHDSHYGLISDNVVYNWGGALVSFEDGSESYNVLESNFAVRSNGTGGRRGEGREGGGFWFRGPNNYVRNNVAANIMSDSPDAGYGFKYFMEYLGNINVPNFKGADTSVSGQYTTRDAYSLPILEFSDNEVYGATASGFSYWWVGLFGGPAYPRATQDSVFKNLHIWHVFNKAIFHYPSMRIIFDGLVIRGKDPGSSAACCGQGIYLPDYTAWDVTIKNSDIQGMNTGIVPSTEAGDGLQTIENSYLRNLTNLYESTLWASGNASFLSPRKVIVRNTKFAAWPGNPLESIVMNWDPSHSGSVNTTQKDELLVYCYQGNPNDNFQVYYAEQATQNIAGGSAPCTNTRPEIVGLVCPIPAGTCGGTSSPQPPSPPAGLSVQ